MSRSQPATFNESWSDERVFAYLNHQPSKGDSSDFGVLYQAYKHMRVSDFERLLVQFLADGRDIQAKNANNQTIHEVIAENKSFSEEFLSVLSKF